MDSFSISLPFAFLAGLVSFLSPCVLPVVPTYVTYVSGLTLDELAEDGPAGARRKAVLHSSLFILGFLLVFMTLGASATAAGQAFNRLLPMISRLGGVFVLFFGLLLLAVVLERNVLDQHHPVLHLDRLPCVCMCVRGRGAPLLILLISKHIKQMRRINLFRSLRNPMVL